MKAVLGLGIYLPQEEGSVSDKGGEAWPLQLQVVWRHRPEGVTVAEVWVRNCHLSALCLAPTAPGGKAACRQFSASLLQSA